MMDAQARGEPPEPDLRPMMHQAAQRIAEQAETCDQERARLRAQARERARGDQRRCTDRAIQPLVGLQARKSNTRIEIGLCAREPAASDASLASCRAAGWSRSDQRRGSSRSRGESGRICANWCESASATCRRFRTEGRVMTATATSAIPLLAQILDAGHRAARAGRTAAAPWHRDRAALIFIAECGRRVGGGGGTRLDRSFLLRRTLRLSVDRSMRE